MTVYGRFSKNYSYVYVEVERCYDPGCYTDEEYRKSGEFFWPILMLPQMYFRLNET